MLFDKVPPLNCPDYGLYCKQQVLLSLPCRGTGIFSLENYKYIQVFNDLKINNSAWLSAIVITFDQENNIGLPILEAGIENIVQRLPAFLITEQNLFPLQPVIHIDSNILTTENYIKNQQRVINILQASLQDPTYNFLNSIFSKTKDTKFYTSGTGVSPFQQLIFQHIYQRLNRDQKNVADYNIALSESNPRLSIMIGGAGVGKAT